MIILETKNIWNAFLEKIKSSLSPILYETWFENTKLIEISKDKAVIVVPMEVHKKHLRENYYDLIFRNTTSYTARMFGYQYRKFLNELALLTNGEVKKTNSFSGFVYYWFPGFLFKKDNLKIELKSQNSNDEIYFMINDKDYHLAKKMFVKYAKPFEISQTSTIEAYVKTNEGQSNTISATFLTFSS